MIVERSAGAVVYRWHKQEREYLLLKKQMDNWTFPQGRLEGQESRQEAAKDEVYRTVGLRPKFDFTFHQSLTYLLGEDRWQEVTLYSAKYLPPQEVNLQSGKIQQAAWVSYSKALHLLHSAALKNVLQEMNKHLALSH